MADNRLGPSDPPIAVVAAVENMETERIADGLRILADYRKKGSTDEEAFLATHHLLTLAVSVLVGEPVLAGEIGMFAQEMIRLRKLAEKQGLIKTKEA